jgi:hypothetical protein
MRFQPRQIYTSVRSPDGAARRAPAALRRIGAGLLTSLPVATVALMILSLL